MGSGVARIFQQGGPKRGSVATERGKVVGEGCPSSHGREIFFLFVYENSIFFHIK